MNGCQPNFSDANPCQGQDPTLIREQGRPGAPGVPGGTPIFQVGTVLSGATPAVTYTMINPLLYRVDYIIPGTATNQANTWTATQTFSGAAIFQGALTTTGGATIDTLHVTGDSVFDGATTFGGAVICQSSFECLTGITTDTLAVTTSATVGGAFTNSGAIPLPAGKAVRGIAVLDSCGRLYYINGIGPNSAAAGSLLSQSVTYNQSETAISFTLPFTVPNTADCGSPASAVVNIFGRLVNNSGGALPSDISAFITRVRLDDPATGTICAQAQFTNFQREVAWNTNVTIPPGAHTMYFTIQGQGDGSSSITLTEIDCSINF